MLYATIAAEFFGKIQFAYWHSQSRDESIYIHRMLTQTNQQLRNQRRSETEAASPERDQYEAEQEQVAREGRPPRQGQGEAEEHQALTASLSGEEQEDRGLVLLKPAQDGRNGGGRARVAKDFAGLPCRG